MTISPTVIIVLAALVSYLYISNWKNIKKYKLISNKIKYSAILLLIIPALLALRLLLLVIINNFTRNTSLLSLVDFAIAMATIFAIFPAINYLTRFIKE